MTMNKKLSAFVMSITPFDAGGALDEPALRAHLRRLQDAQVRVYVGSSASGESFSLTSALYTYASTQRLYGCVCGGCVGVGGESTSETGG